MNQHQFNEYLIDFVRNEEVLYQSHNLNFTNSSERHLAYERIAEKLRQHGATFEQTHRLNEKFLKLKWRFTKEYHLVESGKRSAWPYYDALTFLLPSILDLERKRMNASVPEDNHTREDPQQQYVEVQACDVMPSTSTAPKPRGSGAGSSQKRKAMMYEETDNRLMEKRRVTNMAFAEFVACKLDEMPEPIRSHTERQIIELVMSVHVETYQEISQSAGIQQIHANERDIPIATEIYHPAGAAAPEAAPEPAFDNCQAIQAPPAVAPNARPRARAVRKSKVGGE